MIYEISIVTKSETSDERVEKLNEMVREVLAQNGGEVLVQDDWGVLQYAQLARDGVSRGRFLYFIYKNEATGTNAELVRRLRINEDIHRHLIVTLGRERDQAQIVKSYKTPFSKKYNGSAVEQQQEDEFDGGEGRQDRRQFSRRKGCWFSERKIQADWKDPNTYAWLINEFGKINPARVSNITRKHQTIANEAIKRARNLGIASYVSNRFAEQA